MKANAKGQRVALGEFIVADPAICHGKPTYKGTRVMVWQVLAMLERGESWDYIRQAWPGRISCDAIAEHYCPDIERGECGNVQCLWAFGA